MNTQTNVEARVIELLRQGKTVGDVAYVLDVSAWRVRTIVRDNGLQFSPRGGLRAKPSVNQGASKSTPSEVAV